MLLGENILTLSLYLYRKKTYSSNLLLLKYDTDMKKGACIHTNISFLSGRTSRNEAG